VINMHVNLIIAKMSTLLHLTIINANKNKSNQNQLSQRLFFTGAVLLSDFGLFFSNSRKLSAALAAARPLKRPIIKFNQTLFLFGKMG